MAEFSVPTPRVLQVDLQNGQVMARSGAMVAYQGQVKFEKAVLGGEGIFGALKRKATGESLNLMTVKGNGRVYFAHEAAYVSVIPLQAEKLFVESSVLLAFSHGMKTNTSFAGLRGASSGQGLFTTSIEGPGFVAVYSHAPVVPLSVTPQMPLHVDPDAFVGYYGQCQHEFVFDVNWRSMIGQTSGETYQMRFTGQGVVFIQPAERK